jgi:pimeloyl-ACP methyl ester carboxylesterase
MPRSYLPVGAETADEPSRLSRGTRLGWVVSMITVNSVELYYEVYGDGVPILGIHGTPSSAQLWVDAAQELARRGRCVIYDRRGFSRSRKPGSLDTANLADHVQDAAGLLDALEATPAVVIGRSTGGLIALELACRYPDKVAVLVLLEPAVFSVDVEAAAEADRIRREVLAAADEDPTRAAEAVLRAAFGDWFWDGLPSEVKSILSEQSPAVLAEIRGQGLDLSANPRAFTADELASIRQPTLLVSAQDSLAVLHRVNNRLAQALPHVETALIPGGHLIDPAHPVVLGYVERFIAS